MAILPGAILEIMEGIKYGETLSNPFSRPVASGTRGTVKVVDDMGSIHMQWDNGRTLALIPGEDRFRKLTQAEIAQEQQLEGMECQTM